MGHQNLHSSVVSSRTAFNQLGATGDLLREIEAIATIGRKERWILESATLDMGWHEVLGEGGFGTVYCARMQGTPVVVKMPRGPLESWVGRKAHRLQALGSEVRLLRR